jgi:hypothetical protein
MLLSIKIVRKSRSASKMLYSAYHLNVFFELALRHVTTFASRYTPTQLDRRSSLALSTGLFSVVRCKLRN